MDIVLSNQQRQKYIASQEEIRAACNTVKWILLNWGTILKQGKLRLLKGIQDWRWVDGIPAFDPGDPYSPYGMKDLYFSATNKIWEMSMWKIPEEWKEEEWFRENHSVQGTRMDLMYPLNELYFKAMLPLIRNEESTSEAGKEYKFNKGMVYANLGVAQASQMKLDEGFANILNAFDEDRGYHPDSKEAIAFKMDLFTQFERKYIKTPLIDCVTHLEDPDLGDPASFAETFLTGLKDYESRVFFDVTFAKIIQNWEIWRDNENLFTSNRLLAYLQDLCLFAEDWLKKKGYSGNGLDELIFQAFGNIGFKRCGANSLSELDQNLCSHMNGNDPTVECIRVLLTVRNFTSHNVAGGTGCNFFYREYEHVLLEIVRALTMIHKKQPVSAQPWESGDPSSSGIS